MSSFLIGLALVITNIGIALAADLSWWTVVGVASGAFLMGSGISSND